MELFFLQFDKLMCHLSFESNVLIELITMRNISLLKVYAVIP